MLVLTIEEESSVYIGDLKITVLLPGDSESEKVYLQVHFDDEPPPNKPIEKPFL